MPDSAPHILFLCAYPQPFLIAGIKKLRDNYNAKVLVVHWPVADESPTAIDVVDENVCFIDKRMLDRTTLKRKAKEFEPDIVYSAGWMDKDYLAVCKMLRKAGKITVMGMDTQWKALPRQRLHSVMSPFTLRPIFNYAWVPGPIQYEYARRLGFSEARILNYLYAPDTELFRKAYKKYEPVKAQHFPKAFLYVGRLVEHKFGPLLKAFIMLSEEERAGWKLVVAGKGPLADRQEMRSDAVVYKSFLQQDELVNLIGETGVFCLLSTEEPWGTVIQEFAAGGMPVLASRQCGVSYKYVIDGENGYVCDGNDTNSIKAALLKMIHTSEATLLKMGERSMQIASPHDSNIWAKELMSVIA